MAYLDYRMQAAKEVLQLDTLEDLDGLIEVQHVVKRCRSVCKMLQAKTTMFPSVFQRRVRVAAAGHDEHTHPMGEIWRQNEPKKQAFTILVPGI